MNKRPYLYGMEIKNKVMPNLLNKEREKEIMSMFFVDLIKVEEIMGNAINKEIDLVDPENAHVSGDAADIMNSFSAFIEKFDDILRDKYNVDTLELD
jgi:VIT1/CCC1 family predicted Fe2+/Mn2+ transporter